MMAVEMSDFTHRKNLPIQSVAPLHIHFILYNIQPLFPVAS